MEKNNSIQIPILDGFETLGRQKHRGYVKVEELVQLLDIPPNVVCDEVDHLLGLKYLEPFPVLGIVPTLNREVKISGLGKLYLDSMN